MNFRWRLGWLLVYPIAKLIMGLRVLGRDKLRQDKAKIIAANHTSNLDPFILGLATGQEIFFLAKEDLFNYSKWFTWLIRFWNALPLRRSAIDRGLFKTCSRLLQRNKTLILFPEGTRSKNGNLQPFKPGIGLLAVTNSIPVVPCYIYGARKSFISKLADQDINKGKFRVADIFTGRITVKFGNPIQPDGFSKNRDDYIKLTAKIRSEVEELGSVEGFEIGR